MVPSKSGKTPTSVLDEEFEICNLAPGISRFFTRATMLRKVHISKAKTATFVCPHCDNTKTVDVARFAKGNNRTRVHSQCTCGYAWTSILERRKSYRMTVNLPGIYMHRGAKGPVDSMPMRVIDLSATGLKIKHNDNNPILPIDYLIDDPVSVEFHLSDRTRTHIRKTAYIKNVSPQYIGAEFEDSKQGDHTIGAYILSQRHYQMVT